MTRADHPSGTDRAAEVASAGNAEIIVNIQGDEPLIDPNRYRRCSTVNPRRSSSLDGDF